MPQVPATHDQEARSLIDFEAYSFVSLQVLRANHGSAGTAFKIHDFVTPRGFTCNPVKLCRYCEFILS